MTLVNPKYAIYPGSVTTYEGVVRTFTAAELAALYNVASEPYLTVASNLDIPKGRSYFYYIHLKPRADDNYTDMKAAIQDDDQLITWGPDFDGDKQYIQQTNRSTLYADEFDEEKLEDDD